jgi:hypothetical protein
VGVGVGADSDRRPCSRSFGAVLFGFEGSLDPVKGRLRVRRQRFACCRARNRKTSRGASCIEEGGER